MAITLTIVRHGESTDNLKPVWAGWANAPLSNHGMNQAKALGASLAETRIDAIYASDLLRAHWTAQAVHEAQDDPKPPLEVSALLREMNFGEAERKPFGEKGGYMRGPGRNFKFASAESLNDVRDRANKAISIFLEPHIAAGRGKPARETHIMVVAHGIFNAELVAALLARRKSTEPTGWGHKGMTNTGWTRLLLAYEGDPEGIQTLDETASHAVPMDGPEGIADTSAASSISDPSLLARAPLDVCILCADVTKHLDGLRRQGGGIGSQGFDKKQKDLRAFFGGASKDA